MPSGKTHDEYWKKGIKVAYLSSFVFFIVFEMFLVFTNIYPYSQILGFYLANSFVISIGNFSGYLIGRVVTPDLDDAGVTKNEWMAINNVPVLGAAFVGYWMVYGDRFTHRGFWSHSYIVSSFIRTLYLFAWFVLLDHIPEIVYVYVFGIFLGLSQSDAIHIYLDTTYEEKNGKFIRREEKCRRNSFGNLISKSKKGKLGKIAKRIKRS